MKTKIGIVVLVAACAVLAIAWLATKKQVEDQHKKDADAILGFSNQWFIANEKLGELRQVNFSFSNNLAVSRQEALTFSNRFIEVSGSLAGTKASLQSAQEQVANLNGRIGDLETQNQALEQRAAALTNGIAGLNTQIADTQQKLANSETNNAFLEKELQRQTTAKAELERKFNDLSQVRTQVKKLREDLVVTRRVQWVRSGTDPNTPHKGAQLLVQRLTPARPTHYDLNVEIGSDGSIHVVPPSTNAPATATNPRP
jgi:uncharacterized protein (DUF3084 family)